MINKDFYTKLFDKKDYDWLLYTSPILEDEYWSKQQFNLYKLMIRQKIDLIRYFYDIIGWNHDINYYDLDYCLSLTCHPTISDMLEIMDDIKFYLDFNPIRRDLMDLGTDLSWFF